MFAIVNLKGKQYRISEKDRIFVPHINEPEGSRITLGDVLMYSEDNKTFRIGTPKLDMKVEATVLGHIKDDKVIVFKKKRRKNYKRTRGHRQKYTEIEINSIK
jgi:large subunit ribosomal protein L21